MPAERIARHASTSDALARLDDRSFAALLESSTARATGIGGTSGLLEVDGTPLFVKRVPLTDRERGRGLDQRATTRNHFNLPPFYQYGVGSTGFGVWRELAALTMTTQWVVDGVCECFPLLHHWRILEGARPPAPTAEARSEIARAVAFWEGSTEVGDRLDALARASASIVLVLEALPFPLDAWLTAEATAGRLEAAVAMVDRELPAATAAMNDRGLFHFDAHFANVLTDGSQCFFADFGLATAPTFELSPAEAAFLDANRTHDLAYGATQLVNWLVMHVGTPPAGPEERNAFIRDRAVHGNTDTLPPWAAAIVTRDAPIAALMNDLYWSLHTRSRATPYPRVAIEAAIAANRHISPAKGRGVR